jgi:hypothetical protein
MARRSNPVAVILAGLGVGVLAWWLWTRKPLVTSTISAAISGPLDPSAPPMCTTPILPDITLPDGTVIPGGAQNTICRQGG